jgi:proline-specific peptidase
MLAMEYALTQPAGLASIIVSDSPASMVQWVEEANRLRAELPTGVQETLLHHEKAGSTDAQEYQDAVMVFYRRHLCRLQPWPECLQRSFSRLRQEVYLTMNGPSEFHVTGNLKNWDIIRRLGEIQVPTLVLSGKYDEATPAIAATIQRGIPGAEAVLFEKSSHLPHLEEPEAYFAAVEKFLERVEARSVGTIG